MMDGYRMVAIGAVFAGLAVAALFCQEGLRAECGADDGRRDDERKPPEGCGLPVAGAPATHPGRDVVGALQRCHFENLL